MEQYFEFPPYTRVDLLGSGEFTVWTAVGGARGELLGPSSSNLRRIAVTVPPGCDGLLVYKEVSTDIRIVSAVRSDSPETPDQTRIVVDDIDPTGFEDIQAIIKREFERLGLAQHASLSPGDEDDDDFEVEDDGEDEPFAMVGVPTIEMAPDMPDEMSDEKVDEQLKNAAPSSQEVDQVEPPASESAPVAPPE